MHVVWVHMHGVWVHMYGVWVHMHVVWVHMHGVWVHMHEVWVHMHTTPTPPCNRSDATLKELRVKSIGDLAKWKYAQWAEALVAAADYEADDFRHK